MSSPPANRFDPFLTQGFTRAPCELPMGSRSHFSSMPSLSPDSNPRGVWTPTTSIQEAGRGERGGCEVTLAQNQPSPSFGGRPPDPWVSSHKSSGYRMSLNEWDIGGFEPPVGSTTCRVRRTRGENARSGIHPVLEAKPLGAA